MDVLKADTIEYSGYTYNYKITEEDIAEGKATTPFGVPERLEDHELFKRPFWKEMRDFLIASFVFSSGRQYGQFCDMIAMTALWKEMGKEVDWEVLNSPLTLEVVRSWDIPDMHTSAPKNTDGQIAGLYEYWWRMLVDAMHAAYDPGYLLLNKRGMEKRFEHAKVEIGPTSSTTPEEVSTMNEAVGDIRDKLPDSGEWTADEVIAKSLKWHLRVSKHWSHFNRTRKDKSKGGDVHEDYWRNGMIRAAATPIEERTIYDHLLVRQADALDFLLNTPDEDLLDNFELIETKELYYEALSLYNNAHKNKEDALSLHRSNEVLNRLGIAGVLGATTARRSVVVA